MIPMTNDSTSGDLDTRIGTDGFGPNQWLVDQMYKRFQEEPDSVSDSWKDFFAGYRPHVAATPTATAGTVTPPPVAEKPQPTATATDIGDYVPLRGAAATIAERMAESRDLPTATSVRTFPAKLLEVNRRILNNQLARLVDGGKVSFTHLIGWAVVQALKERPAMNAAFREIDGKPHIIRFEHINLGLAMDLERKDGSRTLLVPNIKGADLMDFRNYWLAYEDVVRRTRSGQITPDDFAGTTATLTNPGTVGTAQSVPRLMPGQGVIVGVGRIGYPPEYEGSDPLTLAAAGVGRTLTMTSTYDHRIIQGAESGMFLARVHELLLGADGFYDDVFDSMKIPYVPARWAIDTNPPPGSRPWAEKQARVFQLINMYRVRGHLIADLDPLRQNPPQIHAELDPLTYGLTIWDLDREFATGGLSGQTQMKLGEILGVLRDAYCRTVGIEYMHIQEPDQKLWIQTHAERPAAEIEPAEKGRILAKLNEAESFERYLHTKFLGAKRFSLEGSESIIPLLDAVLNAAADAGMEEAVLGMAHRGRLNVLANVVGKPLESIFQEFLGVDEPEDPLFSGDVKYHLGARGRHEALSGSTIMVEVAANPSHLEAVDPVLEGIVRAKQDMRGEGADDLILPLLIHGDAAFSGQGVVAETLNLSQLRGYYTGGTVHVVINNQVGFTTSAAEARSSFYATDIAKAVQAPIIHVNADDPEAVVRVARMAFQFRQAFHKDVVIDLICYRRLGHNEGDEPTYTQPKMYGIIESHRSVRKLYLERLINRGEISVEEGEQVLDQYRELMDVALDATKAGAAKQKPPPAPAAFGDVDTRIERDRLAAIEATLRRLPEGFTMHPKLAKQLGARAQVFAEGFADWAHAEALAWGTLSLEGVPVRLAGEDSQRGTFSHRHAVLVDYVTEERHAPLRHLHPDQAPIYIIDSLLSEFAAMGFEYGYSVANPKALVMWEAQFGDFVNGAQVVIDQFITSGEDKWNQFSSLTLMLPHGFEGQGPEHSSARFERFLQNAAEQNMRIAVPSTTAQLFHLLRRQAHDAYQKPLVVMSPKSLLRTRETYSPLEDFSDRGLQLVIPDMQVPSGARRVVLCSGKVYYDLVRHRTTAGVPDVAVVRVEQLYPFPAEAIQAVVADHPDAEVCWVQEEPANMGAWRFMSRYLFVEAGLGSRGIYRRESASPATGNPKVHAREQQALIGQAFA
jgi:2-oxoglutarate dehydrogenase E1 component